MCAQLQVQVASEREYRLRLFSQAAERIRLPAVGLAILLTVGAAAASMNAMSAAIVADQRLVATLRALGFSPATTAISLGDTAGQPANLDHFSWRSDCSGLFHTSIAA